METDRKVALRAFGIAVAILRDPFDRIGKPEPLKYLGANVWCRRLTGEHRIVYLGKDNRVEFLCCRSSRFDRGSNFC